MRRVGVSSNGLVNKGLAEFNQHMLDEEKEVSNGVDGGGQGLSEQDESRIIEDADNEKGRRILQVQPVAHRQQPQGPVVRWERLLPFTSIRVLLVENDDATRHIVSALLRNCSYEVTAVANGLEAWKTLEGPTDHIDLVLTEVDMPYLSGIGLLSKILSHKTCKHIPLIMMSSNDSMGIVFKCLSKGAVDFLVKPIRKNELKNLWQHVWRKCHNQSTFSGSESGIRIQKSSKSRSIDGPENNNGSNGEDDIWSTGTNAKDGSDNGSGTQSSWKKGVAEVDNTKPMTQWDKLGDPTDSPFAQVIHLKSEPLNNYVVRQTTTRECRQKGDELDNVSTGTYLNIGIPINQGVQLQEPSQSVWKSEAGKSKSLDLVSKKDGEKLEKGRMELNNKPGNGKLRKETSDLMDVITNSTDLQMGSLVNEDDLSRFTLIKDKTTDEIEELPSFEPDLNTLRDGDTRTSASGRNVLRHSDLSAFSRYNTSSNANQTPTGNVDSCSPPNTSSEATKIRSNSNGTHNQHSNGSSNSDDMGSTTNNGFSKLEAFNDKQTSRSIVNVHPRSAFQSVKADHNLSIQPEIQDKTDPAKAQARVPNQQVQRHHLHYHHHHYHVHTMQQNELPLSGHGNLSLRNTTAPIEGNAANYSLNGSGSSCNNYRSNGENGSNGQNAYNIVGTVEGTNMESDHGGSQKFGADDGNRSGSRSGVDQNRWALREAALNKFRQKRKDRCFEKKVRYQSRKRLAEQRPRVKGQFVRQVVIEGKMEDPNS